MNVNKGVLGHGQRELGLDCPHDQIIVVENPSPCRWIWTHFFAPLARHARSSDLALVRSHEWDALCGRRETSRTSIVKEHFVLGHEVC
jgi:hypothetical protein